MSDIQKCEGGSCTMKRICERYTSRDDFINWEFDSPPYYSSDYGFQCKFFIDDKAQRILNQFKDLFNEN